jgi:hypothetical protein
MNKISANFTIFVLFFGLALVEAVKNQEWVESILFLALGAMFLWADRKKPK